jgi:hypothetical protein
MQISTLRPGLLVSLKTSVTGNVSYAKRDIETDHDYGGGRRAIWETERTIADPAEHENAIKARGKARTLITKLCAPSTFGLLCPDSRRAELDEAIRDAREVADEFNAGARLTTVAVHVLVGRVSADDVEAVRAINSEVRDLLAAMEVGIEKLDPSAIRDAATKARTLGQMLSPFAEEKVSRAIEVARSAAKRIAKDGEVAADVAAAQVRIIRSSRAAFLDLDEAVEVARPVETAGRSVDFMTPDTVEIAAMVPAIARQIEL